MTLYKIIAEQYRAFRRYHRLAFLTIYSAIATIVLTSVIIIFIN
jgi:hypothetical protein